MSDSRFRQMTRAGLAYSITFIFGACLLSGTSMALFGKMEGAKDVAVLAGMCGPFLTFAYKYFFEDKANDEPPELKE